MHDQANDLRRLASRCASQEAAAPKHRPRLIVLASGKGGVGTTTIAVNLAVAMARRRLRTVLVDADADGGDAAFLCGLEPRYSLADVLAARRTTDEALQPGPGAVQVLPGVWGLDRLSDCPSGAGKRLLDGLTGLGGQADLVVLDGGNSPHRTIQPLWQAADLILVLTAPETSSIINTYGLIKVLAEGHRGAPIHSLVNLAPTAEAAHDVQRRLAQACRRFLAVQLIDAGHVPADPHVARAAATGEPFVIGARGCHAARHVGRLAHTLAASLVNSSPPKRSSRSAGANGRGEPHEIRSDPKPQETINSEEKPRNHSTSCRPRPIATEHCR